jgi:hypothetical protein
MALNRTTLHHPLRPNHPAPAKRTTALGAGHLAVSVQQLNASEQEVYVLGSIREKTTGKVPTGTV